MVDGGSLEAVTSLDDKHLLVCLSSGDVDCLDRESGKLLWSRDALLTTFTASVALQQLALKMSLRKLAYLDSLNVPEHGVHPDVPKNVSKSITVD